MNDLNPRLHAYRSDLADIKLRDEVTAESYVKGSTWQVAGAVVPMFRDPGFDAAIDSEVLFGEPMRVFDMQDDWAWCQSDVDGYVGYVPKSSLSDKLFAPTHRVATLLTPLYPEPELRRPLRRLLSFGSRVKIVGQQTVRDLDYAILENGSAICATHLSPLSEAIDSDYVTVAERFTDLPYLWAGRSGFGVDCSGLVQLAMMMTGSCPLRDSDMQESSIGQPCDPVDGLASLSRGDLIFWNGHVGIATDSDTILHASGRTMSVIKEPVVDLVDRLAGKQLPVTSIRRPTI